MLNLKLNAGHLKIHFIGIGGISMSALAEIMQLNGHTVSGSDMKSSEITDHLKSLGLTIYTSHGALNIQADLDLVVYTAAISPSNPELIQAKALGLPILSRSKFLGLLMNNYDFPICVSGTHGKTTTTSMLTQALLAADTDPTITVGGILEAIGGNLRIGQKHHYFVTEACEYCDSFLDFYPRIGIILNIEEDHLDYFKDLTHIRDSFQKFACSIPEDGLLVINGHIDDLASFCTPIKAPIVTFGLDDSHDWYVVNLTYDEKACASFDVYYQSVLKGHIKLHVPGEHNVLNCLSVCAVCNFLNISMEVLNQGLSHFTGANQRFEIKGCIHDITIVDDYAHHPTEIAATLKVANAYPHKHLYVVFQPHTYTRTKAFLNDFATALNHAENVILTDIYAAREKDPGDIHAKDILHSLHALGKPAIYLSDFDAIANYLLEHCEPHDLIITMGAGNVNQIASILLGQ